jgi:hypothetical protein
MKKTLIAIALVSLAAAPAFAHSWSHNSSRDMRSCSDWRVSIDGADALVESETLDVPSSGQLDVEAAHNGGITVVRGSGSAYRVTLCKAVYPGLGQSALADIRLSNSGGRLSVDAPGDRGWSAHFIIEAPTGADLKLNAYNGGISVLDFEGVLDARTVNGPLSLETVQGTINGRTTNGPVTLKDSAGQIDVKTTNGPLRVKVDQITWQGRSLEASTTNGPISLEIPRGFASGTEITARGHNKWDCPDALCGDLKREIERDRDTTRSWDSWDNEPRTLRIGTGATVVRMATKNGPVSIEEK